MPRYRIVRFALVFVAIVVASLLALQSALATSAMWALKTFTASVVAAAVGALGTPAVADGAYVRFGGTWIQIIDECTGVYAGVLLVAFVLAFPATWRRRFTAMIVGVLAINLLNGVRLVTLALLMTHAPATADFAHDYLWQVVWAGLLVGFAMLFVRTPSATA